MLFPPWWNEDGTYDILNWIYVNICQNKQYEKIDDKVFFNEKFGSLSNNQLVHLKDANYEYFHEQWWGYAKDDKMVRYHWSPVIWADTKSFQWIKFGYAKDKNYIWESWKIVEWVDKNSFEVLSEYIIKDKNWVSIIWEEKSDLLDPQSFNILNDTYSKDNKYVYCQKHLLFVNWADATSFTVLSHIYAKDKNTVYADCEPFDADVKTFEIIEWRYAKDKNNLFVFFDCTPPDSIKWVDLNTFEVINLSYSKDKNNVYFNMMPWIKKFKADTKSLEVLDDSIWYSKDKNNVYFQWDIIVWADSKTFKFVDENTGYDGIDKYHKYNRWRIVK